MNNDNIDAKTTSPMLTEQWFSLLRCPQTQQPLTRNNDLLLTPEQKLSYPIINNIPWLLANPTHSVVDWSIKLNHFTQVVSREVQSLTQQAAASSGLTQQRLIALAEGKARFFQDVKALMQPLLTAKVASKALYDTLSDRAPNTQNLLSYEANLYRDWVWGEQENAAYKAMVVPLLPETPAPKLAVLGGGAGRLAYDLACNIEDGLVINIDINPLLMFAAKAILFGDGLAIDEFPFHPKDLTSIAVRHQIDSIDYSKDNLKLLFADGARPAIEKGSMDAVITPWLIDIQPLALTKFLRSLNNYLSVGGTWINFGSLVFQQQRESLCYSIDEIKALAARCGFEITVLDSQEIPYLKSPYNAGYRMETVWVWQAKKVADVALAEDPQHLPQWILEDSIPIPNTNAIKNAAFSHALYAELLKQVDGKRSLASITRKFARENHVDPKEAYQLIKDFFLKLT
ncbi:MAG: hypothetical protein HWE11_04830 [Gammaproteobacteria bacterium]|nr:hypothetical protein [Gammaproteobacteria bacterium]